MRKFLLNLFRGSARSESIVPLINQRRAELDALSDADLKAVDWRAMELPDVFALCAVIAERVLGLKMFDVQLEGALALAAGKIAEMQTGEGKTLAAVPAVVWYAKEGQGVHVMTVNDYLARRDAQWMGGIYEFLGLSVGCVQQSMGIEDRRRAYACDITYATANEIGFDHLRDGLALHPREQVHRPFAAAVIDEADSILIDEARIPLVIAGGEANQEPLAYQVDRVTRHFRKFRHFTLDEYARNIALTDAGIRAVKASHVDEARTAAASNRLSVAILEHAPGHDALAMCRAIAGDRANDRRRMRVLIVADREYPDDEKAGVAEWLVKPFSSTYAGSQAIHHD